MKTPRRTLLSSTLLFWLISASKAYENAGSDPFFYSQSYSFEFHHDHCHQEEPSSSHNKNQRNNKPLTPTTNDANSQSISHGLSSLKEQDPENTNPTAQTFQVVYEPNNQQQPPQQQDEMAPLLPQQQWIGRVEHQVQAYAFESSLSSPFDVRMFLSQEELKKKREQQESDEDDDNDDDDDDENDGSCSMLSNASISRVTLREQETTVTSPTTTATMKDRSTKIRGGAQRPSVVTQTSRSSRAVAQRLVRLRGGGGGTTTATSVGSEVLKRLYVSALVTLLYEACVGHILEFLKIVMQTSPTKTSYGAVLGDITAEKGLGGLWDGFVPWGVVQAVSKGAVFGMAHTTASRLLQPLADQGILPTTLALTLAGGIGGGVQGYLLSPILLLKTRVMTNPVFRKRLSLWKTSRLSASVGLDIVRTEGILTLMKGANIFATKRVFDWSTRYFFAEMMEEIIGYWKSNGQPLSLAEKSVSSFLGGVFSTCFTLPLDVLVAKTQDANKAGVKVTGLSLFTEELKEKGWSGLSEAYLSGFTVRLLHVCLTVVVMKTIAPVVYDALFG